MRPTKQSITVAIVTRNRASNLYECLQSLLKQSEIPASILIINNDSTDETKHVISYFSRYLTIRSVLEKIQSYPAVYNRALIEAKTPYIAFIDDDCVADPNWYSAVKKSVTSSVSSCVVLGNSRNYFPHNPFACGFQYSNDVWRTELIQGFTIKNYSALDSRNIIYNRNDLLKHSIWFDSSFSGGGEDSDLGLQIKQSGLIATYNPNMVVYHKEPISMTHFFSKKYSYTRNTEVLQHKWKTALNSASRLSFAQKYQIFSRVSDQLSLSQRGICLWIIFVDKLFDKCFIYLAMAKVPPWR